MTFLGDERTDTSAVEAMERATPPRPRKHEYIDVTPGPSFFVWLRDERGFLDSYVTGGDWKHYSPAKLLELVKAAHPSRPVTWCDWADRPSDFVNFSACLLVWCAGEKGTPIRVAEGKRESGVAKYRKRDEARAKRKAGPEEEWDAGSVASAKDRLWSAIHSRRGGSAAAPGPAPASLEVVATCACGTKHTEAAFAELELLAAPPERREGGTLIADVDRRCSCGRTVRVTHTRIWEGR